MQTKHNPLATGDRVRHKYLSRYGEGRVDAITRDRNGNVIHYHVAWDGEGQLTRYSPQVAANSLEIVEETG